MEHGQPQQAAGSGRADRVLGLLLFLPVPLVLWLFTRAPLGVLASLALGTLIMGTHRLYARPFALARAGRRCLLCGRRAGEGPPLEVEEPQGATRWRACGERHARAAVLVLAWAERHSLPLRGGILGTLAVFLPAALLAGLGRLGPVLFDDAVAFFRLGIALTVLPLGWLSVRAGTEGVAPGGAATRRRPRSPFPLHIQALVGTWAVLWLFRLVGLYWLVAALWHIARRASAL